MITKTRFSAIPAVYIILRNSQNQILFGQRLNTGFMDGFFGLPSGHVEGQETLKQACVRETLEEIGIEINPDNLTLKHVAHRFFEIGERLDFFFETEVFAGEITNREPHKCSQLAWLDIANSQVIDYIQIVLQKIELAENYSDFGFEII